MDYEKQLKSIGNIGAGITFEQGLSFTPPELRTPYQEGYSSPKISYKQGIAFKPKFVQWTLTTGEQFWAPANHSINPN